MEKKYANLFVQFTCVLVAAIIALPVLYCLSMSFMKESDIIAYPPKLIPPSITFDSYAKALKTIPIFTYILNSTKISLSIVLCQILTSSLAAYAFSFMRFRFKNILFMMVLATMMIPGETTIISNYMTMSSLKLIDTHTALIIPFLASTMGIFLMRQYYMIIPKELKEAAFLDGCSNISFFIKILFPISLPAISALGIYSFIGTWNQYMWPLLITNSDSKRTVQIGISMLQFSDGIHIGLVNAGCMLILLPSIIIFILGQKKIIGSVTMGAVKG